MAGGTYSPRSNATATGGGAPSVGMVEAQGHSLLSLGASTPELAHPDRLAAMLGAEVINRGNPGVQLTATESVLTPGGWAGVLQAFRRREPQLTGGFSGSYNQAGDGPYVSRSGVVIFCYGTNDTVTPAIFVNVLRACIARACASVVFEDNQSTTDAWTYTGTWTTLTGQQANASGTTLHRSTTTGDTFKRRIPPDYPGGNVCPYGIGFVADPAAAAGTKVDFTGAATGTIDLSGAVNCDVPGPGIFGPQLAGVVWRTKNIPAAPQTGLRSAITTTGSLATLDIDTTGFTFPCVVRVSSGAGNTWEDFACSAAVGGGATVTARAQNGTTAATALIGSHVGQYQYLTGTLTCPSSSKVHVDYAQIEADRPPMVLVEGIANINNWASGGSYSNLTTAYVASWNATIQAMLAEFDTHVLYIDADSVLHGGGDSGVNVAATENFVDGVHWSDEGHRLVADLMYDRLIVAMSNSDRSQVSQTKRIEVLPIFSAPVADSGGDFAGVWTNMPAGSTELFGFSGNLHVQFDASGYSQARLCVNVQTAGATGANLQAQFSDDNGATWSAGDGVGFGPGATFSTNTGMIVGGWVRLSGRARKDGLWRIVGASGDGAADPVFTTIHLHFR